MIRRAALIAALAALVLVGIAVFEPRRQAAPGTPATPEGSDYYMRGATVRVFGPDGRPAYRVTAEESLHFPDESAKFRDIDVHYPDGARGVWTLDAEEGRVPPGSRDILLSGNVLLTHNPDTTRPLTVRTERVWVRTQAGRAETEADVTATSPGRRALGNGMTVNFDRETMTLHRDVRVTYTP